MKNYQILIESHEHGYNNPSEERIPALFPLRSCLLPRLVPTSPAILSMAFTRCETNKYAFQFSDRMQ